MFLLRFRTVLSHVDSAGVVVRETTDGRFNLVMEGVRGGGWGLRDALLSEQTPLVLDQGPRQVITPSDISTLAEVPVFESENAFSQEFKLVVSSLNTFKSSGWNHNFITKIRFLRIGNYAWIVFQSQGRQTLEALLVNLSTKNMFKNTVFLKKKTNQYYNSIVQYSSMLFI